MVVPFLLDSLIGFSDNACSAGHHFIVVLHKTKAMTLCRYGGTGAHSRTADVLLYDCTTNVLSTPSIQGDCRLSSQGHV